MGQLNLISKNTQRNLFFYLFIWFICIASKNTHKHTYINTGHTHIIYHFKYKQKERITLYKLFRQRFFRFYVPNNNNKNNNLRYVLYSPKI